VTGACSGQNATQTQNSLITVTQAPAQPVINLVGSQLTSGVNVGTFQWFLNGVAIAGANANTISPAQNGIYTMSATIGNCTKTSAGFGYNSVGILDSSGDVYIHVFPNPAKDQLTIRAAYPAQQSLVDCRMFDLSGKLVFQRTFENVQPDAALQFGISDLSNGMYQLVLTSASGRSVSRVAIAR
jgi:hypothetical protein